MKPDMKNILATSLLLMGLLSQFFYAPQTALAAACDAALFIADVTVPDGTIFPPTTAFLKTWRLKNVGTCTWTTSYKLAFAGGTPLSGPEEAPLSTTVPPGGLVDVSVNLVSLAGNGTYRGYWQLKNAAGGRFGIGPAADKFFWVEIVVRGGVGQSTSTALPVGMSDNFALSAGAASWQSGAGKLTFPGPVGDTRGLARQLDSVKMETGETVIQPSLLMVPQNKTDGYIQGLYPAIVLQNGDHFQSTIGCQYGATACYVTYRIDYRTSTGVKTLWTFRERYEGLTYHVNIDLSFLAGKKVEFFLMVLASGSASGDQAVWIAPQIVRAGGPIPTATTNLPTSTLFAPATTSAPTALPATATPVIIPSTPVPSNDGYNFAMNSNAAGWLSGAGVLPFPGADGDARGFGLKLNSFQMESGAFVNELSLLTVPQNKTDGYIQALFPAQTIQNGDHFQSTIGCQYGATACYVTYRIDYRTSAGVKTLWTFKERYDNLTYNVNLDLSFLAGKNVEFFLLVLASGSPSGDRAVWIAPRIVRAGGSIPSATPVATLTAIATATPFLSTATATTAATATPLISTATSTTIPSTPTPTGVIATATVTPAHGNWLAYTNTVYQFQFQYPPYGQTSNTHITLPFAPNTNLSEKYLDVNVAENVSVCTSPLTSNYAPGSIPATPISFNGIAFVKESGSDGGAGQFHQWTAYSTLKGTTCISLSFVLHSTNPGNYPTPPPVFDETAESAVFDEIMSTFGWLAAP